MASVYVSMGKVSPSHDRLLWLGTGRTETIVSSASAASGTLTASGDEVAKVECATAVIVSTNGTAASASNGTRVSAGLPEYFALGPGASISVIDA
jgi:hypothetical protein